MSDTLNHGLIMALQEAIKNYQNSNIEMLKQSQIGEILGITQARVSNIMTSGKRARNITIDSIIDMITALGCDVEIIVKRNDAYAPKKGKSFVNLDSFL